MSSLIESCDKILDGLKKSWLKVRERISGFLLMQGSSPGWKSAGHPNSFLVPLKNSHLLSLKRLYEIWGGPGYLHIYGRTQKLSIPRPTPYKQSAERISSRPQLERDRHLFFWGGGRKEPQSPEERHFERSDRNTKRCETTVNRAGPIRTKRSK